MSDSDKMREILGVYQEALDRIRGIDPDEWYRGDGWKCVAFIQEIADNALRSPQLGHDPSKRFPEDIPR